MKSLLTAFLFLLLVACNTSKDILYGKCAKRYYACTQLLLKKDGEFEYFNFYDVGGSQIAKGKWLKRKDTIILNTYEQEEDMLSSVTEKTVNSNKVTINLINSFWGNIQVNSSKYQINFDSNTIALDTTPSEIVFNIDNQKGNLIPIVYKVINPMTNSFIVKIKPPTTSVKFKNEMLVQKNKG